MKVLLKSAAGAVLVSATLLAVAPVAVAQDGIDKAIKARQGVMQLYSHYAGPLFGMAKGDVDYDAATAASLAENLNTVVNLNGSRMWPPESHNEARDGKTRALPAIWESGSEVGDRSQAMKDAALALTLAADGGLDGLRGAVGDVGKACKGCHDDYRAEDF